MSKIYGYPTTTPFNPSKNGGSSKTYELIETITIAEDGVAAIERTQEPDGTPYKFERMLIKVANNTSSAPAFTCGATWREDSSRVGTGYLTFSANTERWGAMEVGKEFGYWRSDSYAPGSNISHYYTTNRSGSRYTVYNQNPYTNKLEINSGTAFPIGMTIEIWGVRA